MGGSDWQVASQDSAGVFSRRNTHGDMQLVGGNKSAGFFAMRPNSSISDASSTSLAVRTKAPRIQLEVSNDKVKFRFKGPDGSKTTERALDIADKVASG